MNNKDSNNKFGELEITSSASIAVSVLMTRLARTIILLGALCHSVSGWSVDSPDMRLDLNLTSTTNKQTAIPKDFKLNLIKYDKEEYLLAYNVFVMNGSVSLAYEVATAAVKQRPKSIAWRKKLVTVALWSGHAEVALEQWMYFIHNNIQPELYLTDALKLATQLNDYDAQAELLERKLQSSPNDKSVRLKYIIAVQNQGYPTKALKLLKETPNAENDPDYLQQFIVITKGMGDTTAQTDYLKRLTQVDKSSNKASLDLADILYSKGDLKGAYKIYQAQAQAPDNKIAFWRNYANIALLMGDNASAIVAYKHLITKEAIDNPSLLQMVSLEEISGEKETAYRDAKAAYQATHNPVLIPIILSLGEELERWSEIKYYLSILPPEERRKLEEKPAFAVMLVTLDVKLGLLEEARKTWNWVFQRWPNNPLIQQAYLWFVMDENDLRQLGYSLERWRRVLRRTPAMWNVYQSSLTTLGNYQDALTLMLTHRQEVTNSYSYLTNISNLFFMTDHYHETFYTGQKAFFLLRRLVNKQSGRINLQQQLQLSELLQLFGPAAITNNVVSHLGKRIFTDQRVDNQIMAWMLKNNSYSMASYMAQVHKHNQTPTPPWMTLTIALAYNDRDAMADVLFRYPAILPYRDRVTAADRTGNIKLAEEYAYIGLKEHPKDNDMYKLFEDIMLPRANRFSVRTDYYQLGTARGPMIPMSLKMFVTPSIAVMPYASVWMPRSTDTNELAWTPDVDEWAGIAVRKYIERGWVQASVGERTSLDSYMTARLQWQRRLTPRTEGRAALSYHARATETDALLVGGMKNQASLFLNTSWDTHNLIEGQLNVMQFLGQNEFELGNGEEVFLHWQNKFYLEYPDWNINFYGTWANYHSNNRVLPTKLQRLVPINQLPATSDFYVPQGYTEGGITLGFGQQYRENYTHAWRPFGEAGFLYSFPFGLGEVIEGGIAGSVFGRDHLALYAEYSNNQQQAAQQNYTIGIRYDNYF